MSKSGAPIALTVRGADGREMPIGAASVDRMRHTVTYTQYGGPVYELRMWSEGRRVTCANASRDAVRRLATEVAARHGARRLELGMDWGTSIFYLVIALGGLLVLAYILYMIAQGELGIGGSLAMLPVLALLGFAMYRTMRGRWPPRPAGTLEKFLAVRT